MSQFGTMKTVTGKVIRIKYNKPGPKPYQPGVKRKATNLTLAPHWKRVGKEMAEQRGESLSKYVEQLIQKDSMRIEAAQ